MVLLFTARKQFSSLRVQCDWRQRLVRLNQKNTQFIPRRDSAAHQSRREAKQAGSARLMGADVVRAMQSQPIRPHVHFAKLPHRHGNSKDCPALHRLPRRNCSPIADRWPTARVAMHRLR